MGAYQEMYDESVEEIRYLQQQVDLHEPKEMPEETAKYIQRRGDLAWNKHREERVREMKEREKELIRAQNGYTSRRNPQQ